MTNIFPIESLNHFLHGAYSNDVFKKVRKILQSQVNYEFRDLQLSYYALHNPNAVVKVDGTRYIKIQDNFFPFKQSSPYALLNLLPDNAMYINGQPFNCLRYNAYNIHTSTTIGSDWVFFCSKQYTEETGISPCNKLDKDTCITMYIDYIKWKVNK